MRRFWGFLLVAVLAAPPGAWRTSSGEAAAGAFCALECGHAEGAACCAPSEGSDGSPSFRLCPRSDPASLLSFLSPVLPVSRYRLRPPGSARRLEPPAREEAVSAFSSPPDHVPLSLS